MISSQRLAQSFWKILHSIDQKDSNRACEGFLDFLLEHKLESYLPSIVRYLDYLYTQEKNFSTLIIESPFPIDTALQKHIAKFIGIEKDVVITSVTNSSLIGGFRATHKGSVTDASIAYNLQVLTKQLTK